MADTFTVVTQYPTVEYLGGTQTRDVIAVGYTLKPSGLYFEARIPAASYTAAQVNDYGIGYSGTIGALLAIPGVTDGYWSQTPTAAGELEDQLTLTVTSDSGNSSGTVTVPASEWDTQDVGPKVAKLLKSLNDAEAL